MLFMLFIFYIFDSSHSFFTTFRENCIYVGLKMEIGHRHLFYRLCQTIEKKERKQKIYNLI